MKPPRVEWKGCAKSRPCAVNTENWAYDFRDRAADFGRPIAVCLQFRGGPFLPAARQHLV